MKTLKNLCALLLLSMATLAYAEESEVATQAEDIVEVPTVEEDDASDVALENEKAVVQEDEDDGSDESEDLEAFLNNLQQEFENQESVAE